MTYFLYVILGPTSKIYVGITKNPKERWKDHRKSKRDHPLYRAMRRYGRDQFSMEIVSDFESLDEVKRAEVATIQMLNTQDSKCGYNMSPGGDYDALSGPIALKVKLTTDRAFAKAYSLRSEKSARASWARRTSDQKQQIFATISETLKKRCVNDPAFYSQQKERMLSARAKGDVAKRAAAASRGIKQFWIDLRNDPIRYAEYIERRKQTLLRTLKAKSDDVS